MSSNRADNDGLIFDLDGDGQGGFYRVRMTNKPGEINRPVMINRGEKFQCLANLLDVVHGSKAERGDNATLIIANFYFLPTREKRFKHAQITWTFTSDDPAVDVEVVNIAPIGSWTLAPTTRTDEKSATGTGEIGASGGPATVSGGGEYSMKQTQVKDFHTKVTGAMRVLERDAGGFDTARWDLEENPAQDTGVARMLQVGLLLKRTILPDMAPRPGLAPSFRGALEVFAEKDWWSQRKTEVKRVWKRTGKEDAVVFRPGVDRSSGLFDIKHTDLGAISLRHDVMFMSLHESFEDVQKEQKEQKKREKLIREARQIEATTMSAVETDNP